LDVFISYAEEDADYRDQLIKNLALLEQKAYINAWHEGLLEFGEEKEVVIQRKLEDADLILLLISADFLAADLSYEQALQAAYQRQKRKEVDIVPIIVRSADWEQADFARLPLILPNGGHPINSAHWNTSDEAYTNVVENLKELIERRLEVS